jgi:YidC/Oxa1 family membrane protein insertase
MDKRFFLALVLTAVVVLATPYLFPSARRNAQLRATADSVRADSSRRAAATSRAATEGASAVATPTTPSPIAPSTVAAASDSAHAATSPAPIAAETTLVRTKVAQYRFLNVGATPSSVVMEQFVALDGTHHPVELVRRGERLLSFRLVAPGDTIALDRTQFAVRETSGPDGSTTLDFTTAVGRSQVAIRYAFAADSYLVHVSGRVTGPAGAASSSYLLMELPTGLASQEADSTDDLRHFGFAIKPRASGAKAIPFTKLDPGERRLEPGPLAWAATKSKYFIIGVLAPVDGNPLAEATMVGGARTSSAATHARGTVVAPVKDGAFSFDLYAGPQQWEQLIAVGRDFDSSNPYGGFLQAVVQPFATLVMRVLLWMHRTFDLSYGWVLVIFGIAVRVVLWPLNQSAMRNNLKMQRIQPQLQDIQKRLKSDPAKQQAEIMRVYKEHGMSPFSAMSGCLPMLIPMPILFALFYVFGNTIEFRGVPFLWLADLSLKDPYYILPLAMGISMFVLSYIGMRSAPPSPQTKMMTFIFPVMMTFFLLNFASGLNLYYTVQNLASLPQQWLVARERGRMSAVVTTPVKT